MGGEGGRGEGGPRGSEHAPDLRARASTPLGAQSAERRLKVVDSEIRRWVGLEIGFFSLESGGLRPPQGKVLLVLPPVGVPGDSESGPKPFTSRPSRPSIIRITIF